jgi:uncharacterized protein with GYD domain
VETIALFVGLLYNGDAIREAPGIGKEAGMPTYISLLRWTQQGAQNLTQSPSRLDAARAAFQRVGAQLKDFYMLMGQYDMAVIVEAPDDETVARAILSLSTAGSVRAETSRAFTEEEYRKIISTLG